MSTPTGATHGPGRLENLVSTWNSDGSRRWLRPRLAPGRFLNYRRIVGWTLILFFFAAPLIPINGKPMLLFDVAARRFHMFGATFHPTDSVLLMLLMLSIFLGIFWITAVLGRVWCGWGCPQTVYMEFVFRPIERFFEGGPTAQRELDRKGGLPLRRVAKYLTFGLVGFVLANQFLAYFVGWSDLIVWITEPPWEHLGGFSLVMVTTGLVVFDFAYFREQMCTVVCPYARLQSVLLDGDSLVVGYDQLRGEPRGKPKSRTAEGKATGDCIDCKACVQVCPTGIDIRDGLQLECINCTQCIDACDSIMKKVGKPTGLVRLSSTRNLREGTPRRLLRPRVLAYPVAIAALLGAMVLTLHSRSDVDVTVLRQLNAPFVVESAERVRNQLRVKLVNRDREAQKFHVSVEGVDADVLVPVNPVTVPPDGQTTTPIFVTAPASVIDGSCSVTLKVTDETGKSYTEEFELLGPTEEVRP
ncbi:MAG TPA: cytochrome c oxidase accessory protein CcoG [Myxococcales bacterium LLY-WYZ-16_1]|nr:cytochrome c oxidase accessory protein CcoG [Myxococcales bacterium LLY-WYZ-16_1]